jgi:hypothetical protein
MFAVAIGFLMPYTAQQLTAAMASTAPTQSQVFFSLGDQKHYLILHLFK